MNILMLSWEYPPLISGGLGTATEGLIDGLITLGHHVTLVLPYFPYQSKRVGLTIVSPENPYHLNPVQFDHNQDSFPSKTIHKQNVLNHFKGLVKIKCPSENIESHYFYSLPDKVLTDSEKEKIKIFLDSYQQEIFELENAAEKKTRFITNNVYEKIYILSLLVLNILKINPYFDVVHAHDWMTFEAMASIKKEYPFLPLIAHMHSSEFDRSGNLNLNHKILEIEKMGMEIADKVVAVSQYTKNHLLERFDNLSPSKVFVVYNANNQQHSQKSQQRIFREKKEGHSTVTFVGRITFQKGPHYFVLAAEKVIQKIPLAQFYVLGTGDLLQSMKQLVLDLGLSKNFYFEGFLEAQGVQRKLAQSDVFVMPSVSEPFGIVALEAIAQNVPVIISKQAGVSEVLNHTLKVDFWDTELLADRILSLLKYPLLKYEMVQNSLRDLYQITWVKSAQTLTYIYERNT